MVAMLIRDLFVPVFGSLALSRIQTQVRVLNRTVLNRLGGSTASDSGAMVSETPSKQARNKNAIEAAILNGVLDRD